jgi:hypothetical protein
MLFAEPERNAFKTETILSAYGILLLLTPNSTPPRPEFQSKHSRL